MFCIENISNGGNTKSASGYNTVCTVSHKYNTVLHKYYSKASLSVDNIHSNQGLKEK